MIKDLKELAESLEEGEAIDLAMKEAVREALLEHKRLGHDIVVWRDGKVVTLTADEIAVRETATAPLSDEGHRPLA